MCRTGICRYGIANWIFLVASILLFTYAKGGENLKPDPGVRFTSEPSDEVVLEGDSVMLSCAAASNHPVRLGWRFSASGMPTRDQTLTASDQFRRVLSNGSLLIDNMSAALAGEYQCVATVDGVGTIVSKMATVFLAEVPSIESGPRWVSGVSGGGVLLSCPLVVPPRLALRLVSAPPDKRLYGTAKLHHVPPSLVVNVTWYHNGAAVRPEGGSITGSGALEIDPLRSHHAGTYSCRVALAGRPHNAVSGEDVELRVSTDEATEFPPRFVATPRSLTIPEGASVTFDCAAVGNPKPEITWLNNGVEIDLNDLDSRLLGRGWLRLGSARAHDGGPYTCRAHSRLDHADHAAALLVTTVPRVQVGSGSVSVAHARGSATLPCSARGKPAPTVLWLKDGEPVTPNHHDIAIVDGWSLRIQGVLPVDAGMFQCFALSAAGSAAASLRLVVLPPDDDLGNYNSSTQSLDNTTSSITSSKPHSKSSELSKNSTQDIFNSLVSSGQFGDQSSDLGLDDSDFLGETSSAFTSGPELEYDYNYDADQDDNLNDFFHAAKGLDLNQLNSSIASDIPTPKGLKAVIVKHRFVTLSWDEPEQTNTEITGYAVLYNVKGSERVLVSRGGAGKHEMNVPSLQPNTTYSFRVVALSRGALSSPTQPVEVRTAWEAGGAGGLLVTPAGPRAAAVSWTPPAAAATAAATLRYRLLYTQVETGAEHSQWLVAEPPATTVNATITGLQPAATYTIRVVSGSGSSEPLRLRLPGDVPSAPPGNVTAAVTGPHSMSVSWAAPPAGSQHGPLTGYKLRYRAAGAPGAGGPAGPGAGARRKADSLTTPADARRADLTGLDANTLYQVRVCALNANGSGPFSEWVTPARGSPVAAQGVPPQPPPLTTRAGRDWISVWWSSGGSQGVGVGAWELGWGLGVPDEHARELPAAQRSHVIRGLESNAEYVISLRGSNALGPGPAVYATVRTRAPPDDGDLDDDDDRDLDDDDDHDQDEPLELLPPVGLKVIMLSGTTAVVYWTDPTLPKGQTATDGRRYVVRWAPAGGRARSFNASDLNCMLDELRPNTHYEFAVKLIKGERESQWSMLVSNTTLEAVPSSAPRDLRVTAAPPPNHRAVELFWSPPSRPNGPITGYVVMYALQRGGSGGVGGSGGGGGGEEWAAVSVGAAGERGRARVDRLRPRATYLFKVQARNSKGLGPFSAPLAYTTPLEAGEGGGLASATSAWLWASAGGACAVLALAAALALSLCCRRSPPPLSPDTSTYQKSSASAGIKPPDLWIHHDQMELKHLDKSLHTSAMSAGSVEGGALVSSTLTLARPPTDYEPPRPPPASLDRRHYVPTYVDSGRASCSSEEASRASPASAALCRRCDLRPMTGAGCAATCERRRQPLPDQSTPLLSGVGPLSSPQSLVSLQQPMPTCGGGLCPLGAACSAPGAPDTYACVARERGHYVAYEPLGHYTHRDSLSSEAAAVAAGAAGAGAGAAAGGSLRRPYLDHTNTSDHSTPAHSRAGSGRETSPYKKSASSSPGHIPNRLQLGGAVAHCSEELEPLTPSRSTERLHREMQNLEGLMKDLSAITQQQFHC